MAKAHRIRLVDRGSCHVHRWQATCSCGWLGVFRRRQQEAKGTFLDHAAAQTHSGPPLQPRRPTRHADLPEVLR